MNDDLIRKREAISIPVLPKEYREYQTMNLDDAYELGWYDLQNCIEKLPPAEPDGTDTNVGGTIYRQAAIDAMCEACSDWCDEGVCKKVSAIQELPPAQRWIPCSERLPEDDVEVFVYLFERSSPYIAWVEDYRWYTEDFEVEKENYPTAWMPLPEPLKAKRREE